MKEWKGFALVLLILLAAAGLLSLRENDTDTQRVHHDLAYQVTLDIDGREITYSNTEQAVDISAVDIHKDESLHQAEPYGYYRVLGAAATEVITRRALDGPPGTVPMWAALENFADGQELLDFYGVKDASGFASVVADSEGEATVYHRSTATFEMLYPLLCAARPGNEGFQGNTKALELHLPSGVVLRLNYYYESGHLQFRRSTNDTAFGLSLDEDQQADLAALFYW